MDKKIIILGMSIGLMMGCNTGGKIVNVEPPQAKKIPKEFTNHGIKRVDNYYWLRERENPEVISYLESENKYREDVFGHTKPFQDSLYEEMRSRIKEDDETVPYKEDGYYYITRYKEGGEYPIYIRKKGDMDAPDQILLDGNVQGKGKSYYNASTVSVSADQKIVAYAEDTIGRRFYDIAFRNLETGEVFQDRIGSTTGNFTWANDSKTIFYSKQDPQTLRWDKIYTHILGTPVEQDRLVFVEADVTFNCYVYKSKSKEYIFIGSQSTLTDEVLFIPASKPSELPQLISLREKNHKYDVEHFGDDFYIRTNTDSSLNFKLMKTPIKKLTPNNWVEVIPHRKDVLLEGIDIFKNYLVVSERKAGLSQLRIKSWDGKEDSYIDFEEPTYVAYTTTNLDFNTVTLRFGYSSLTTPNSVFDINMQTKEKELKKQAPVLGTFDARNYVSERLFAPTRDGITVPISLVYKKGLKKDGNNPTLVYAYGSYGLSTEPNFSSARLSLLDRGFVFAIAHIRGGQEMGRQWYEDGKLLKKEKYIL